MALKLSFKGESFGVGDRVKVTQKIKDDERQRLQSFSGIVIAIKGRDENKSFAVRRVGVQKIGIERIFPIESPTLDSIEVLRKGGSGVRHAKLYYTRNKSKKEIEKIFQRYSGRTKNLKKATVKKSSPAKKKKSKSILKKAKSEG
jgi:large subunit ribosomal protein L19